MKRIISVLFLIFFTINPSQARLNKIELLLGGGYSAPTRPINFNNGWNSNVNYGGGIGIQISKYATFILTIDQNQFSPNRSYLVTSYGIYNGGKTQLTAGDVRTVLILANARIHFSSRDQTVRPYFIGGIGVGHFKTEYFEVYNPMFDMRHTAQGITENDFAFRFGIGADFRIANTASIYIETNGVNLKSKGNPSSDGFMDWSGITIGMVKAGIRYVL